MTAAASDRTFRLTPVQWVICGVATLGFAFDTYVLLMAPLVVGPALGKLAGLRPGTAEFNRWFGLLFYVPALAGGAFGLIGGYLTDLLGRRRILVWSMLLYAFSALAAGFSTSLEMLLVLRSTTFIGVCVEFVAALLFGCGFAAAFGAIQQTPQISRGMSEVQALPRAVAEKVAPSVQMWQEMGGLAGRAALAYLAVRIVGRRKLLRIFLVPGVVVIPFVYLVAANQSLAMLKWGIAVAGFLTVAQFSFWGNYLPRVYPTYLRGTGESFAANVGGRMVGTSAALLTATLANVMPGAGASARLAAAAAVVGTAVYVIALVASFWLPEPSQEKLPE